MTTPSTTDHDFPDVPSLIARMNVEIAGGGICFVKWTCPKCGQRVTSGEPDAFHSQGYYHDEPGCGALYRGTRYGLMVVVTNQRDVLLALVREAYGSEPTYPGPLPGLREQPGGAA